MRQNEVILDPVAGVYNYEVPYHKKVDGPLNGMIIEELNGIPGGGDFPRIHLNRADFDPRFERTPVYKQPDVLMPDDMVSSKAPVIVMRGGTPQPLVVTDVVGRNDTSLRKPLHTPAPRVADPKRTVQPTPAPINKADIVTMIRPGGPGGMTEPDIKLIQPPTQHAQGEKQPITTVADTTSATASVVSPPKKKVKAGGIIAAVAGAIVLYGIFSSQGVGDGKPPKRTAKPKAPKAKAPAKKTTGKSGLSGTKTRAKGTATKRTNSKTTQARRKKVVVTGAI